MSKDYTEGRYAVYGYGPGAQLLGWIDGDEFVRSVDGKLLYQVEGDTVYTADGSRRLGSIDQDIASTDGGQFMFRVEPD